MASNFKKRLLMSNQIELLMRNSKVHLNLLKDAIFFNFLQMPFNSNSNKFCKFINFEIKFERTSMSIPKKYKL